jgi:hypothetical protein
MNRLANADPRAGIGASARARGAKFAKQLALELEAVLRG